MRECSNFKITFVFRRILGLQNRIGDKFKGTGGMSKEMIKFSTNFKSSCGDEK